MSLRNLESCGQQASVSLIFINQRSVQVTAVSATVGNKQRGFIIIFGQRSIILDVITDDHCKCGPFYDQALTMPEEKEKNMPELKINIALNQIVSIINSMKKEELESLILLLSEDGNELIRRNQEFKSKKVKYLTRDEVFNV